MEYYLVSAGSGSYDDHTETSVGLFLDKESAEAYCKTHNDAETADRDRMMQELRGILDLSLAEQELLVADPVFQKEYWQQYTLEWLDGAYNYEELREVEVIHRAYFSYYINSHLGMEEDSSYYHCSSYPVPVL